MQFTINSFWLQAGGFLIGVFIGTLILLATVKNAKSRLKDPWEEMDEEDAKYEQEQSENEQSEEDFLSNSNNPLDIKQEMCYTDTNAPNEPNRSSEHAQVKE